MRMLGLTDLRLLAALGEEPTSVQRVCRRTARTGPALDWHAADEALERLALTGYAQRWHGQFCRADNRLVERALGLFGRLTT